MKVSVSALKSATPDLLTFILNSKYSERNSETIKTDQLKDIHKLHIVGLRSLFIDQSINLKKDSVSSFIFVFIWQKLYLSIIELNETRTTKFSLHLAQGRHT